MPTNTPVVLTSDQIKNLVMKYPKIEPLIELRAHTDEGSPMRKVCDAVGNMANDLLAQLTAPPATAPTTAPPATGTTTPPATGTTTTP